MKWLLLLMLVATPAYAQERADTIVTRTVVPRPGPAPAARYPSDSAYRKQLISLLAEMQRERRAEAQGERTVKIVTMVAAAASAIGIWILVFRGSGKEHEHEHEHDDHEEH